MFRLFVSLIVAMIASTGVAASAQSFPEFGPNVSQPQLQAIGGEGLLLVWKQRGPDGSDLFVSYSDGGSFSAPMRINDVAGSVNRSPIDEMRASVSIGPGDKVAVAWTDRGFDIRVAVGDIGGRFEPAVKLNQTEGRVLQEFPSISFDAAGVIHAVWLDPRVAERERAEEPADLYYARLEDGVVTERNLTADQDSSVCGCCLPDIRVGDNGRLTITFRNTTADGYRDPFKIVETSGGHLGSPEPVSPPIWKINACPVAGPISVGERTLWFDGSTGRRRLLSSSDPDEVIEDSDDPQSLSIWYRRRSTTKCWRWSCRARSRPRCSRTGLPSHLLKLSPFCIRPARSVGDGLRAPGPAALGPACPATSSNSRRFASDLRLPDLIPL